MSAALGYEMMLGSTPSGDAYTFPELERMFANAGFTGSEMHEFAAVDSNEW